MLSSEYGIPQKRYFTIFVNLKVSFYLFIFAWDDFSPDFQMRKGWSLSVTSENRRIKNKFYERNYGKIVVRTIDAAGR
jgi:hypothetical protein